jgi:hypothetical protein
MSAASRQRQIDKGRAWSDEQREAYRERRRAVKFRSEIKQIKKTCPKVTVEAPVDSELIEF